MGRPRAIQGEVRDRLLYALEQGTAGVPPGRPPKTAVGLAEGDDKQCWVQRLRSQLQTLAYREV